MLETVAINSDSINTDLGKKKEKEVFSPFGKQHEKNATQNSADQHLLLSCSISQHSEETHEFVLPKKTTEMKH